MTSNFGKLYEEMTKEVERYISNGNLEELMNSKIVICLNGIKNDALYNQNNDWFDVDSIDLDFLGCGFGENGENTVIVGSCELVKWAKIE